LDVKDFEKAIEVNRPTVTMADIQKHIEFTNESGESALLRYGLEVGRQNMLDRPATQGLQHPSKMDREAQPDLSGRTAEADTSLQS
jgi:hypothetical protein